MPVAVNGSAKNAQDGLYTSASIDQPNAEVILKAVNATNTARTVRVDLKGAGSIQGNARLIVLASADLKDENSLDQPTRLAPVEKSLTASSSSFDLTLVPQSFTVIRPSIQIVCLTRRTAAIAAVVFATREERPAWPWTASSR